MNGPLFTPPGRGSADMDPQTAQTMAAANAVCSLEISYPLGVSKLPISSVEDEIICHEAYNISKMKNLMESCPGKTAVSGVMGFALGGAFGLFMASVRSFPVLLRPFLTITDAI
jgi:hypothetical protein